MKVTAKYIPCDCGGRAVKQTVEATVKAGGQSITRKIGGFVCPDCGEKYYDGPALLRMEKQLKRQAVA